MTSEQDLDLAEQKAVARRVVTYVSEGSRFGGLFALAQGNATRLRYVLAGEDRCGAKTSCCRPPSTDSRP